jgi:hypothetical protein
VTVSSFWKTILNQPVNFQVQVCSGLGSGELDFYSTIAEFGSSWSDVNLTSKSTNFTDEDTFDVWIPFKKNPATGNYEYVIYEDGRLKFNTSMILNGSLWVPGSPSVLGKECVSCVKDWGCYDTSCSEQKEVHKCKFTSMTLLQLQGLCDKTSLGLSICIILTPKSIVIKSLVELLAEVGISDRIPIFQKLLDSITTVRILD